MARGDYAHAREYLEKGPGRLAQLQLHPHQPRRARGRDGRSREGGPALSGTRSSRREEPRGLLLLRGLPAEAGARGGSRGLGEPGARTKPQPSRVEGHPRRARGDRATGVPAPRRRASRDEPGPLSPGKFEESLAAAQRARDLRPDWDLAWNNICAAHNSLGHLDEAIAAGEKAVLLEPRQRARPEQPEVGARAEGSHAGEFSALGRPPPLRASSAPTTSGKGASPPTRTLWPTMAGARDPAWAVKSPTG